MNHDEINRRWVAYERGEYDARPAPPDASAPERRRADLTALTSAPLLNGVDTGAPDFDATFGS